MVGTVVGGGFVDMDAGVSLWWLHRSPWQQPPVIDTSMLDLRPNTLPTWVEILSQIFRDKRGGEREKKGYKDMKSRQDNIK